MSSHPPPGLTPLFLKFCVQHLAPSQRKPLITAYHLSGFLSIKEVKHEFLLVCFVIVTVSFRNGIICIKPCVKLCHLAIFLCREYYTDIGRPAEKITLPSREEAGVSSTEYDHIVAEVEICRTSAEGQPTTNETK